MPNIKSAEKRARTNRVRRDRNRQQRSRLRSAIKRVRNAGSIEEGREALLEVEGLLDRLSRKGIIHHNAAARHKIRLHRHVSRIGSA